jgi:hypothetical protein
VALLFFIGSFGTISLAQTQTRASEVPSTETESIFTGINAQGEKVFILRYLEEKVWRVDEIVQHKDGWQDLLSRKYFNYRSEAEQTQTQLQSHFTQVQKMNPPSGFQPNELVLQGGSLWPTTQTWSWEWEKKYAQWLTENMNAEFYKKYNLATDCADVAYSARWIFARIHGLPAANHLSGSGALLTNQSLRPEWANLPSAKNWFEDKRFRAVLNYLLNQTYTHLLMRDSYPVAINPENFLPGVHHLDLREVSGHTQLVHRVDLSDQALIPYMIIQSTTPRQVRILSEALFWGDQRAKKGQNGFLRILWPKVKNGVYSLEKPENMPGYSLDQYAEDFIREKDRTNSIEVLLRLKPSLNFVNVMKSGYQNLLNMFQSRMTVVEEGYRHCQGHSCAKDGQLYNDWSTPSRDRHILEVIHQLDMLSEMQFPEKVRDEIIVTKDQALKTVALVLDGEAYTLKSLIFAWSKNLFSSDPNEESGLRWGLAPEFFAQKMQGDLTKLLSERKAAISKEADNLLRRHLLASGQYCSYFSESQCLRFTNQELTKPFNLLGQSKSLQAWLEQTLWLNSDPLQTPANQWGALRTQSKYQALSGDVKIFLVSKEGIGYMEMENGAKRLGVIGLKGLEDQSLPQGFQWVAFQKESSIGWALSEKQILLYDFKSNIQKVFALPAAGPASFLSATDSRVLLQTPGEVWSLEVQGESLTSLWHAAVNSPKVFQNNILLGQLGGQWNIFEFNTSVPFVVPVKEDLSSATVFKVTNRFIGLIVNKKSLFIEKSTASVTDVTSVGSVLRWSEGLTKAIVWNAKPMSYDLVSLDAQFKPISSKKISEFGMISGDYFIAMSRSHPQVFYQMKGEDFIELPYREDEEGNAYGFSGSWVLMKLKSPENTFRLRSMDGSKTLYEGGPFMLIAGQQTPNFIFSQKPGENELRLISLKNPKGPAFMTGEFYSFVGGQYFDATEKITSVARGLV